MFRPSTPLRLLFSAFALATAWSAHATTYDAVKDYSLSANPNGVWSYGALSQTTGGAFTAFTSKGSDLTFPGSQDWYSGGTMTVEKNTTGSTYTYRVGTGTFIIPPDQLRLDGQADTEAVRFTVPADGVYNVSGFFQRNDDQGNSAQPVPVTVSVVQNGTSVLFQQSNFTVYGSQAPFHFPTLQLTAGSTVDFVLTPTVPNNDTTGLAVSITPVPAFFAGQVSLDNGVDYLAFSNGNYFGYYSFLSDSNYLYHFDLSYEYIFDAKDGQGGVYLYDFESNSFFYTSPTFGFPYLYDFSLNAVLYYYPDPNNPGRYNTNGTRYFYNYATGQIITK